MNENQGMEVYYNNTGYPSYTVNEGYIGYFDALPHPPLPPPPLDYVYPPHPLPMHNQESAYWSMNMNSYRSDFSDAGTSSYYGYEVNNTLPRTDINRRNWEYSSPMHVEQPTVNMQSEENPVASSDGAEDSPEDHQDGAGSEVAWHDNVDPDNMTYEELVDLGQTVGTESRGLTQELIKLLPTSRYKAGGFFSRKKSKERCVICLVTYKIGDQQITLPCKHVYHTKCGRKWLSINKTCPVCNSRVFVDDPRNSS